MSGRLFSTTATPSETATLTVVPTVTPMATAAPGDVDVGDPVAYARVVLTTHSHLTEKAA